MTSSQEEMDQKNQSLVDHLGELRTRIVQSLYGLLVTSSLAYWQSEKIFDFIRKPVQPYLVNQGLVYTGPLDKFMAHLKLGIICGVILSCPFWLYQLWKFIAPGLYQKEKKYMFGFISVGSTLFLAGCAFSYYLVLPMAFHFLFTFGGDTDKPMITIESYLSFFSQMCLMFGVSFELPLILIILGMMGLISQAFLKEKRRYAIMILALVSGLITPPDIMSMLMMLAPMIGLYEIGVFFVGFFEKKRAASEVGFE